MVTIREETSADFPAIDALVRLAFANNPHSQQNEATMVRALRRDGALTVALVAELEGQVVGHVAVSPVTIADGTPGWYGLGPLAVLPEFQGRGIGNALVRQALERLRAQGAAGWVVLGDPGYYRRFGFAAAKPLTLPGVPAEYFQAMLIAAGAMPSGVVSYHSALMGEGLE